MKIGIDISQIAYEQTGVSMYLEKLVRSMIKQDTKNEYVLFFSSLRRNVRVSMFNEQNNSNVKVKRFRLPPTLLDLLWNRLHIAPIEWFIGDVDIFITSDWIEPPTKQAKKATILYDLIVYKAPHETHRNIVDVQKRKLSWVKKESSIIFCISEATKKDAQELLKIDSEKLKVIYPGVSS